MIQTFQFTKWAYSVVTHKIVDRYLCMHSWERNRVRDGWRSLFKPILAIAHIITITLCCTHHNTIVAHFLASCMRHDWSDDNSPKWVSEWCLWFTLTIIDAWKKPPRVHVKVFKKRSDWSHPVLIVNETNNVFPLSKIAWSALFCTCPITNDNWDQEETMKLSKHSQ